ncbi:hypothetical protein BLA24_11435 [Streptomyces cinnamoneus]|uniref:Uncharacterized protein n=1 Tax=Streptomyces cinnamoneus TaxID=53446 RepID=A0A2G1XKE3_STRCJ|nr:hypothetical protein [Streptomyces cinnamoneus]PHQ51697.1 hypothetical protein BLA24_11435 [Streptomyces cinnamoneus]PPT11946.1 hypothetical protein CYQ11_02670 [Streptomyces cinnamoneus]
MPEFRLEPPPERSGLAEFPAVVEPPISDIPAPAAPPGPAEPVTWERTVTPSSEELLDRAVPLLLADARVRTALDGHRYVFLGASLLADDKDRTTPATLVLVHDYTDGRTLEITLDADEHPAVLALAESAAQPGLSDAEIARAVAVARTHSEAVRRLPAYHVPMVLLTSDVHEGDEHHGHRRAYVGFGQPDRRLPRLRVVVDLGEERVLGPGGGGDE